MISVVRKDGLPLVADAEWASDSWHQARGLLGAAALDAGHGLILAPCRAIHTWFMRFALDVIFFARDGRVVRMAAQVKPFRMVWGGWTAWGVLEMQAGWFPWANLKEGDQLIFRNKPDDASA